MFVFTFLTLFVTDTLAAPGDFDQTFGTGGQAINTIPGAYASVVPAIQSDGKIVLAQRVQALFFGARVL